MGELDLDGDLTEALTAVETRQRSPHDSLAVAERILSRDGISLEAQVVALWAKGVAERELNRLESAEQHLRQAIDLGEQLDEDPGGRRLVAQVTSALVAVLAARGRLAEALDLADAVRDELSPVERAELDMKRAVALEHVGRPGDALGAYAAALAVIEDGPDRVLEARLRCNRSVVLAYQGRTTEALADAKIAERLATDHEQSFLAAGSAHNQAFIAGLHGDLVAALAAFARADDLYAHLGYPGRSAGVLASDRCEVLLAAGLASEARASAERAVESLGAVDDVVDLAEARLLLARACLAAGDHTAAWRAAQAAKADFTASDRPGWAIAAEFVSFNAARRSPDASETMELDRASQIADDLDALGWSSESTSVRVTAAEIAILRGDRGFARDQLAIAGRARGNGRADRRASAWLATARLRQLERDHAGARRAALAGLDVVTQHQMTLGATDLRVGFSAHAEDLSSLGLAMAVERGRPRGILEWAERVRANALSVPSVRPPDDSDLAAALVELRRLRSSLDEALRAGLTDPSLASAVRRQENAVRDLARVANTPDVSVDRFSLGTLQTRLEGRQLVEYVESAGRISAVVVDTTRCRWRALGSVVEVEELVDLAVFALSRLARTGGSPASMAAAADSLDDALARLDEVLVAPLRLTADSVVIVPTGALHGVPWGGLPTLLPRAVSLAMSAGRWSGDARRPGGDDVAVITGPGLVDAAGERSSVTSSRPAARALADDEATVAAALDLLGRSDTVHLACHGSFRSDSPMFSSLALADGPLTVYDIESLAHPPTVVVLPACNAGVSAVSVGDEVIGTASALLGTGVRTVIAPVTVVNDAVTVDVMRILHEHLAQGVPPELALAATRGDVGRLGRVAQATAAAFLCLQ